MDAYQGCCIGPLGPEGHVVNGIGVAVVVYLASKMGDAVDVVLYFLPGHVVS